MRIARAREGSTTQAVFHAWPLFLAMALIMLGNGLQGTLIGLRATLEGFPPAVTGFVMSGYFVGFLFGSTLAPKLMWQVGHVRVYAGLASLASTATLAHLIVINPFAWGLFRIVTGFCLAGLYIVAESWLNGASTNANRGKLLSVYMLTFSLAMAGSQGLLTLDDPGGFRLFIVASVLVSLAVVPISLTPTRAPAFEQPTGVPIKELFRAAPLGMTGAAVTGLSNGALLSGGPVYGAEAGMTASRVGLFIALSLIGQLVFQWPIGALSDRISRRRVILGVTTIAGIAAGVAIQLDPLGTAFLAAAFVFGGMTYPMYSLSVSHVNDVVPEDKLVAASAAMIMMNGLGAISGPIVATGALTILGVEGFWIALAVVHGGFGFFASYRVITRRNIDVTKRQYLPIPSRATLGAHRLLRDRRRQDVSSGVASDNVEA
jgi:MFS family permease